MIARARLALGSEYRVIAINDAIYLAAWADWLHACDGVWWFHHIQAVHEIQCIKTTLDETIPEPWVTGYLENSGSDGFDEDPSRCRTGANGVFQAMHIAIHAGVKQILLFGVDMKKGPAGESHWFGEHPAKFCPMPTPYEKIMAPKFPTLLPALEARGIEVINLSPGTALDTFPTGDYEKILRER